MEVTESGGGHTLVPHVDMSAARATEQVAVVRRALSVTDAADHDQRAALLSVLASAEVLLDPGAARDAAHSAMGAAQRAGTPVALLHALLAQFSVDLSPEALDRRRALASRAMDLLAAPDCAAPAALRSAAYFAYLSVLTESGDVYALDEALSRERHLRDHLTDLIDHRFAQWFRCSRASMDGRLALSERLAGEAYALAVEAADVDAEAVWAGQIAVIRWMQGRISEMEQVFLHARRADPGEPVWGAAVAWIWVHQGRMRAARGLVSALPDLSTFVRGRNYLVTLSLLAEVLAAVGAPEQIQRIERELLPFSDRVVTMGLGVACWGTAARPLALLAQARGDIAAARRWYTMAIELCSRIGAQPWLARAQVELAALHATAGDTAAASTLASESVIAARLLGLRTIELQADRLLRSIGVDHGSVPAGTSSLMTPPARSKVRAAEAPAVAIPAGDDATTTVVAADSAASSFRLAVPGWARSRIPVGRGARDAVPPNGARPRVTVLGTFEVVSADGTPAIWKSRRAATLLKILLARRGVPLARESAMGLLWPEEQPDRLRNRLSVAMTAVRRALDPGRHHPADFYLVADSGTLRVNVDHLSVDVEDFLELTARAQQSADGGDPVAREALLRHAVASYTGDALADEPYAAWAEQLREQAHLAFFAVSHALAELVAEEGHHLERVDLYRGIIALDPYDLAAHDGLIDALTALGATAHVAAARADRHRRAAELGLPRE